MGELRHRIGVSSVLYKKQALKFLEFLRALADNERVLCVTWETIVETEAEIETLNNKLEYSVSELRSLEFNGWKTIAV